MIQKAIQLALVAHDQQERKGTKIPYIFHPIEVGNIICKYEDTDTDLICAGILHDTVEDTGTTLEMIEKLFNKRVAELVKGETEDKSKSWEERKQHTVDYLRERASEEIKIIACADKLSNMRDIEREYRKNKEDVFTKFKAKPDRIKWYYQSLVESLSTLAENKDFCEMYYEFKERVEAVFGRV